MGLVQFQEAFRFLYMQFWQAIVRRDCFLFMCEGRLGCFYQSAFDETGYKEFDDKGYGKGLGLEVQLQLVISMGSSFIGHIVPVYIVIVQFDISFTKLSLSFLFPSSFFILAIILQFLLIASLTINSLLPNIFSTHLLSTSIPTYILSITFPTGFLSLTFSFQFLCYLPWSMFGWFFVPKTTFKQLYLALCKGRDFLALGMDQIDEESLRRGLRLERGRVGCAGVVVLWGKGFWRACQMPQNFIELLTHRVRQSIVLFLLRFYTYPSCQLFSSSIPQWLSWPQALILIEVIHYFKKLLLGFGFCLLKLCPLNSSAKAPFLVNPTANPNTSPTLTLYPSKNPSNLAFILAYNTPKIFSLLPLLPFSLKNPKICVTLSANFLIILPSSYVFASCLSYLLTMLLTAQCYYRFKVVCENELKRPRFLSRSSIRCWMWYAKCFMIQLTSSSVIVTY